MDEEKLVQAAGDKVGAELMLFRWEKVSPLLRTYFESLADAGERHRPQAWALPSRSAAGSPVSGAQFQLERRWLYGALEHRLRQGRSQQDQSTLVQSRLAQSGAMTWSLSHCEGYGALALAPHSRVGVDIELASRAKRLSHHSDGLLTDAEEAEIEKVTAQSILDLRGELALRRWVCKEAHFKANRQCGDFFEPTRFKPLTTDQTIEDVFAWEGVIAAIVIQPLELS